MNRHLSLHVILGALLAMATAGHAADESSTTDTRLREALRSTMLQLQDAQGQVATLQAQQDQNEKDKTALQAKLDAMSAQVKSLTEQAATDKTASDKAIADLKQTKQDLVTEMVDTLTIQINLLNKTGTDDKSTLEKSVVDMKTKNPDTAKALDQYGSDIQLWKTGYYQYVVFSNQTEAARAKLAEEKILLKRIVDDRERKNLELYNTASEILTRYEKFSLGDALAAKEPFIGVTRVKLQEQVQDYKDKILTEKIRIGQRPANNVAITASAPAKPAGDPVPAEPRGHSGNEGRCGGSIRQTVNQTADPTQPAKRADRFYFSAVTAP